MGNGDVGEGVVGVEVDVLSVLERLPDRTDDRGAGGGVGDW